MAYAWQAGVRRFLVSLMIKPAVILAGGPPEAEHLRPFLVS